MNKREAKAKAIVEAIVADLNKNHGYEFYIKFHKDYFQLKSGRLVDALSIKYPNHEDHGSFGLVTVFDKPTYVRLLKQMLKTPEPWNGVMMYHTSLDMRVPSTPIDIKKMYGKTIDEIQIALDLAA